MTAGGPHNASYRSRHAAGRRLVQGQFTTPERRAGIEIAKPHEGHREPDRLPRRRLWVEIGAASGRISPATWPRRNSIHSGPTPVSGGQPDRMMTTFSWSAGTPLTEPRKRLCPASTPHGRCHPVQPVCDGAMKRRRLSGAVLGEAPDRDAEPLCLVGEVFLDPCPGRRRRRSAVCRASGRCA